MSLFYCLSMGYQNGAAATLKFIKDSIFAPWLTVEWYEAQYYKTPQLRFQME